MSRIIDVDPRGGDLLIRFPYDPELIPVVKSLPGRRWNPRDKIWLVSVAAIQETVAVLVPLGFSLTPAARSLHGGDEETEVETAPRVTDSPPGRLFREEGAETYTVSALNQAVRGALGLAFPHLLWVRGEILEWSRNAHKKHVYFKLAEKEDDQSRPRAAVTVVVFERTRTLVARRISQASAPFEIEDGIEVRLLVKVDLFPPSGQYQLVVEDIDPLHTLGHMARERARLLEELARLGLLDKNLSLPLPVLPLRVALVTSDGSDAFNDFKNEIEKSGFRFRVELHDAHMQGRQLPSTLGRALRRIAARQERYDVVVIMRGGGSRADLAWFDDRDLALLVARLPLKVVCGIGHHRDVSVLDIITTSVKTPTAAAELLVSRVRDASDRLSEHMSSVLLLAGKAIAAETFSLGARARRLGLASRGVFSSRGRELTSMAKRLSRGTRRLLRRGQEEVPRVAQSIASTARGRLREGAIEVDSAAGRLSPERILLRIERERRTVDRLVRSTTTQSARRLAHARSLLEGSGKRVAARDPKGVLRRGFAILRDEAGRILRSARSTTSGSTVRAELDEGTIVARVTSTETGKPAREEEGS
jgi:exodeoxyribonuclease VII large subunit